MSPRRSQLGLASLLALSASLWMAGAAYRECVAAYAVTLAEQSPARWEELAAITPGNADVWRQLGQAALETNPQAAAGLFRRALSLNPADAQAYIGLGLIAEADGNSAEAERNFLAAAAGSRRFRPQFALAYFYARQAPVKTFWPAAIRAASVEAADLRPLFSVVHSTIPRAGVIAQNLRLRTQHSLASYAQFLLEQPDASGLAGVAAQIDPAPARKPLLLAVTDRLLRDSAASDAVRVWNRLYPGALDPAKGLSLTNPGFHPGDNAGFDWRPSPVYGVFLRQAPDSLRVELSGRQPENAMFIEQIAPVLPRRRYCLRWKATLSGSALRAGLHWRLRSDLSAPIPIREGTQEESVVFTTGPREELLRLSLCYTRPSGATRMEGVLDIQSVELTLQ
ncbi:MAG TPA: hypothetical protein VFQ91_10255 [Bryobacteraceae bacterium]|nr:hypothetical protein [Bryobacteraceae bacterium]